MNRFGRRIVQMVGALPTANWLQDPSNALGVHVDLDTLRARLHGMTDAELHAFGKQMHELVYPFTYDGDGKAERVGMLDSVGRSRGRMAAEESEMTFVMPRSARLFRPPMLCGQKRQRPKGDLRIRGICLSARRCSSCLLSRTLM